MMDSNNLYRDFEDEIANYEFQKLFYEKFEASKLDLLTYSLKDCLNKVIEEKKPLIFFLHDDKDEHSRECIELLNDECVEKYISEHFLILGWRLDVRDFINLAKQIVIVEKVGDYIRNGNPRIFTIIPNMNSVEIHQELKITEENTDKKNWFLNKLRDVKKIMSLYIKEEDFANMTSIKYQQWMYDELGDRDYDSFENDEHAQLKDKLLYAMFGPPKTLNGYEEKQKQEVETIYTTIRSKNNAYSKWNDRIVISFIYNCLEPLAEEKQKKARLNGDYKSEQDFYPAPVFVIRKCKLKKNDRQNTNRQACRTFIDSTCRIYDNWEKYLQKNVLPPGKMIYPVGGKYQSKDNTTSEVALKVGNSPSSSAITSVLKTTDIGTSVVGLLSGAAIIASTFTPLAAVTVPYAIATGITTGLYAAGRGTATLVDRSEHEQSINITDSESRAAYLNIATAALGVAGAGATTALTSFTRTGVNIGTSARYTVNIINGANILMAGTATANGFYDVYQQWSEENQAPSSLVLLQLGSSLFFFGNSVVNFRTAGSIIKEVQTSTLNEIDQAIRSNRQRKTFNKLLKETTRVKGNAKGRAEVISTMRNSATRDDILGVLTRSNKNLNKSGIRFSAEGGGIALNGVPVDILEFGSMPKSQHSMYFEAFPSIPESHHTSTNLNSINTLVENMQLNENVRSVYTSGDSSNMSLVTNILNYFKDEAQREIIKICENFMNLVDIKCVENLKQFLSGDIKGHIIRYVAGFIQKCAMDVKATFERRLLNEDVNSVREEFGLQNPQIGDFINFVVNKFIVNNKMMDALIADFHTWVTYLNLDKEMTTKRKEKRHVKQNIKIKKGCSTCGGYYYEDK